jgi:hypothetical protein
MIPYRFRHSTHETGMVAPIDAAAALSLQVGDAIPVPHACVAASM